MFDLLATRRGRLAAFFLLYVTEGIPFGFTSVAVATVMRKQGLGPAAIGSFVAMLYFPWAWKWAAGPFVDLLYSERLGRRRAWIVACQLMMALTLLAAMPIDFGTRLALFTAVIALHNVFSAIQDVAIDALAVSVLPAGERGLANGLMFAGSYAGSAVGGAGVLYLAEWVPFNATFLFVAAAILTVTAFVAVPLREPRGPAVRASDAQPPLARAAGEVRAYAATAARAMLGSRPSFAGLIFALLPNGSLALGVALSATLAVDLGMSESSIATLTLASALLSAGGCVVGGALSDRIGRRRAVALFALLTATPAALLGFYFLSRGWVMPPPAVGAGPATRDLVTAFVIASLTFSTAQGLIYGTRTALFMDLCDPAVAATQFTAYMALLNLVLSYSAMWMGRAVERIGYPATLLIDAGIGLVSLAILPLTLRRSAPTGSRLASEEPPPFASRAE